MTKYSPYPYFFTLIMSVKISYSSSTQVVAHPILPSNCYQPACNLFTKEQQESQAKIRSENNLEIQRQVNMWYQSTVELTEELMKEFGKDVNHYMHMLFTAGMKMLVK